MQSVREEWRLRADELVDTLAEERALLRDVDGAHARKQKLLARQLANATDREAAAKQLLLARNTELGALRSRIRNATARIEADEKEISRLGVAARKLTATGRAFKLRAAKRQAKIEEQQARIEASSTRIGRMKKTLYDTERELSRRERKHALGSEAAERDLERWRAQFEDLKAKQDGYGLHTDQELERLNVEGAVIEKELLEVKLALGKDSETCAGYEASIGQLEDELAALYNRQDARLRHFDAKIDKIIGGDSLRYTSDNLVNAREAQILATQCREWIRAQRSTGHQLLRETAGALNRDVEGLFDAADDKILVTPNAGATATRSGRNVAVSAERNSQVESSSSSWDIWLETRRQKLEQLKSSSLSMRSTSRGAPESISSPQSSTSASAPSTPKGFSMALDDLRVDTDLGAASSVIHEIDEILTPRKRGASTQHHNHSRITGTDVQWENQADLTPTLPRSREGTEYALHGRDGIPKDDVKQTQSKVTVETALEVSPAALAAPSVVATAPAAVAAAPAAVATAPAAVAAAPAAVAAAPAAMAAAPAAVAAPLAAAAASDTLPFSSNNPFDELLLMGKSLDLDPNISDWDGDTLEIARRFKRKRIKDSDSGEDVAEMLTAPAHDSRLYSSSSSSKNPFESILFAEGTDVHLARANSEDGFAESLFRHLDKNGDGVVNVREFILGLRGNPELANLLHLPSHIHQEDGTRDVFEKVFQDMDRDGHREVSLEEFRYYLSKCGLGEAATTAAPSVAAAEKNLELKQRKPSWSHLPLKIAGFDRDKVVSRLWAQAALYFREADRNDDGLLTHTEIRLWLRENLDTKRRFGVKESCWTGLWAAMDLNADGAVNEAEWCRFFTHVVAQKAMQDEDVLEAVSCRELYII
jgi:hypothetical protein